jgi:hypothetical protein
MVQGPERIGQSKFQVESILQNTAPMLIDKMVSNGRQSGPQGYPEDKNKTLGILLLSLFF